MSASRAALVLAALALASACSDESAASPSSRATIHFDPEARFDGEGAFFDFPYPSDLRLTTQGTPAVEAFPDPGVVVVKGFKSGAGQRKGFPVVPAGYFKFTAKLAPRDPEVVVEGGAKAPILLLDVDPASPERGRAIPVVAETPNVDPYVPENLLAVAARPGFVLAPKRKYAFVVTRGVGLEGGGEAAPPEALAQLARGEVPAGAKSSALRDLYAPLWETLDKIALPRSDVAGATVFTTGDVVADNAELGDKILAQYKPEITDLTLEADPDNRFPDLCHVRGKILLPQFQKGTPPFDTDGLFEMGSDGLPIKQRDESVPISISIPRKAMPAGGYPLVIYFHGSGGVSRQLVDGGDAVVDPKDQWPGVVLARRNFAMAGSALPISPERVPGASDFAYVNANNLIAVRDTFRQGILESRIFISALERVRVAPAIVAACTGPTLPPGEDAYHFASGGIHAQGQSMGGMYTNLVSASEPQIKLAVPTGAGGFWSYFLLKTGIIDNLGGFLSIIFKTQEKLSFIHPVLHIGETAIESVDPLVSANRVAQRPLAGHPARSVYEPAGKDDSYFPTVIYDAMSIAYGHPRAGDEIWSSMTDAQKLIGLDTPVTYPVKANLRSETGAPYTGVIVQYEADGTFDAHGVYKRVPAVVHQYACFHETFRKTGVAVVSPPASGDAPCAE